MADMTEDTTPAPEMGASADAEQSSDGLNLEELKAKAAKSDEIGTGWCE